MRAGSFLGSGATPLPFDDGLVLTTQDGVVCALNGAGRRLWEALQVGCTVEELSIACARESDLAADAMRARIIDALQSWRELGLLGGRSPPGAAAEEALDPEPGRQPALDAVYLVGDRPVRVRCDDVALGTIIDAACGAYRVAATGVPTAGVHLVARHGRFAVHAEDAVLTRNSYPTENPASARHRCLTALLETARQGRRWLGILHASAVADSGRCVALAGESGSGKSTLAMGLVAAGASFLSDDYAPLECRTWLVWSVPYAPSIKEGSWGALSHLRPDLHAAAVHRLHGVDLRYLTVDEAHRVPLDRGLPVHRLVFPQYRADASFTLRRLTPTEALARLCLAGSMLDRKPEVLREMLRWVESVPAHEMIYHDLGAAVDRILSLLHEA